MSDNDILQNNGDGVITVTRIGNPGQTLWSDSVNQGTVREQRVSRSSARDRTVDALADRIADAIVRRLKP